MLNSFENKIIAFLIICFSIAIHEFAHAKVADSCGDPTPSRMGRVTLNPLAHLDPMGTMLIAFTVMAGFGLGWGKPVLVDPRLMRNPRWDHLFVAAAGPLSNLIQAIAWAIIFRIAVMAGMISSGTELLAIVCLFGVFFNIILMLFNLIPLGPLDGHWIVGSLLPPRTQLAWYRFNRLYGLILLLGILVIGWINPNLSLISWIIGPPTTAMVNLLMGR
ncbi:MAG: site-2 protease family protein [Fimbriimonadaceae bacterium]